MTEDSLGPRRGASLAFQPLNVNASTFIKNQRPLGVGKGQLGLGCLIIFFLIHSDRNVVKTFPNFEEGPGRTSA